MIISMRIRMQGFIVMDYEKQYPEARNQLAQWLSEGKLKRKETIVKGGLPKAEQALVDLYNGANTGKSIGCNRLHSLIHHREDDGGSCKAR